MTGNVTMVLLICCSAAVMFAFFRDRNRALTRWIASLFVWLMILITGIYAVLDYLTGRGIDESVVYHLKYGLAGAGFGDFIQIMLSAVIWGLISVAASVLAYRFMSKQPAVTSRWSALLGVGLAIVTLALHPATSDLIGVFGYWREIPTSDRMDDYPQNYTIPGFQNADQLDKPVNLVFIYLESLEYTYFDESLFPGLVPGLKSLEAEAVSFTDVQQFWGTTWTVGGMTASQCGIPLYTPSDSNSMSGMDAFLPRAICLGDFLSQAGYDLEYMGGASLEFAGKGKFYKGHGFNRVRGREELAPFVDHDYLSAWGLFDDSLFGLAAERLGSLAKRHQPFALFLLTLDTHQPKGNPSRSCADRPYGDGKNPILNAVHCSDYLVTHFIRSIQGSELGQNTLIIVASDHLAMPNTATELLKKTNRRNLLMMIPPDEKQAECVDRAASTLDIAPTVLSQMGFDVPEMGFGRDLLRKEAVIAEKYQYPNQWLVSQKAFYNFLWEFPQLDDGMRIDGESGNIQFGNRILKLPALITLHDSGRVRDVRFEFSSMKKKTDYYAELREGMPIIWIDKCKNTDALSGMRFGSGNELCVAMGRMGTEKWMLSVVKNELFLSKEEIMRSMQAGFCHSEAFDETISRIERLKKYGAWDFSTVSISDDGSLSGELMLTSNGGYENGQSSVVAHTDENEMIRQLDRGITLLGIMAHSPPEQLAYIDPCAEQDLVENDNKRASQNFAAVMDQYDGEYGAYVIAVHDSAMCNPSFRLDEIFNGLPLRHWKQIGFRQPYLGIIAGNGEIYEVVGEREKRIALLVRNFVSEPVLSSEIHHKNGDNADNG